MTHDANEKLCQFVEMTEHDYESNNGFYAPPDCQCVLIAKVRKETLDAAVQQGHKDGYESAREDGWLEHCRVTEDALDAARRIVAGFLDIDETGERRCSDPACELCVVAPLIYAALEDLSKGRQQ